MLSCPPPLFDLNTPGVLALAALRSGFRAVHLSCQQYLKHVAQKAAAVTAAGGTAAAAAAGDGGAGVSAADAEQQYQQLLATLAAVDQLAAEVQGQTDNDVLKTKASEVDRAIKLWKRSVTAAGGGGPSSQGGGTAAPAAAASAAVG